MDPELIVVIVSAVLIVIGVKLRHKGSHLLHNGKRAKAIVFRNNQQLLGPSSGMHYPVVRFLTDKEEWITQELNVGYSPPLPEGKQLEVIYDPDDPTTVEINSSFQLEILPTIFLCIGIIGFLTGMLAYSGVIEFNITR